MTYTHIGQRQTTADFFLVFCRLGRVGVTRTIFFFGLRRESELLLYMYNVYSVKGGDIRQDETRDRGAHTVSEKRGGAAQLIQFRRRFSGGLFLGVCVCDFDTPADALLYDIYV